MVRIEELRRLRTFLQDEVKDHEFDIGTWVRETKPNVARRHCGTVGCAIGLGCLRIPEWKEQGFTIVDETDPLSTAPKYKGAYNYFAIRDFFNFDSLEDTFELFFGSRYSDEYEVTRHHVIAKLDRYIQRYEADVARKVH